MRYTVSFKKNKQEKELEKWILEKSTILGFSNYMKHLAYEEMKREEVKEDNSNMYDINLDFEFKGE